MRLLFLFVLLLNLAFFVWIHNRQTVQPVSPPAAEKNIDPLVLLRERDSSAKPEQKTPENLSKQRNEKPAQPQDVQQDNPAGPAIPSAVNPPTCYTAGPFVTAREAADVADKLKPLGIEVRQRVSESNELSAYWVYLPPFQSRERAQEATRELARRGVKDYFVVSAAGKENAVSLGVFSTREAAERRRNEIAKLGYAPALDERYHTRFEYWLDYSLSSSATPSDAVLAVLQQEWPDARVSPRSCE